MALLEVRDLTVGFDSEKGFLTAVDSVSFSLEKGKTLGIVGESGSGKSVTATALLGLLPAGGRITGGRILFMGQDLARMGERELRRIRGDRIAMIFQEPMTALNPVLSVARQLAEPFLLHRGMSKKEAYRQGAAMLSSVGFADPEGMLSRYPHALSGGQRQRVMIAMALACHPDLLIADEPTTALDVTVQAEILSLVKRLQRENETALLFITHDLSVIRQMADTVAVFYCGRVVEEAPTEAIFHKSPFLHPYTEGLLACRPERGKMRPIKGSVPPLHALPRGCRFAPRCPYATPLCEEEPPLYLTESGHTVRCHYPRKEARQDAFT